MLSHKKIILFPISHIKLCTILSWCRQHFHSALFYIALSLSQSFSLPVMIPSPFLLWCFGGFGFFSPLQTARRVFYWRKGQRWWYFPSLEVILQKPVSFPLLKISPRLFLPFWGMLRWDSYCLYSPAFCSRTLVAGWPSQVSFQLVLGAKQHELLLHPLNIASCPSNTGTKPIELH